MTAAEIRKLAESQVLVNFCGGNHLDEEPCSECFDHSEHICQDKEDIKSALLAYAEMVERCEKVKRDLVCDISEMTDAEYDAN